MGSGGGGAHGDADPKIIAAFARVPAVLGSAVAAVGALVLVGWTLGSTLITNLDPSLAPMKVNTALSLVALGLALRFSRKHGVSQRLPKALGAFAAALGAAALCEYALGVELGIDQLVARDHWSTVAPGRMSMVTATHFVLLGVALMLADRRFGKFRPTEWLALLVGLSSLLVLLGYAYGVRSLYALRPYNTVALHTTLAFLALVCGILCQQPERGVMAFVTAPGPGGTLARRLLPAIALVPTALAWLRVQGQNLGLYGTGFGVALLVLSNIACLAAVVISTARALENAHVAERRLERSLHEAEAASQARFKRMTEAGIIGIVVSDPRGNISDANDAFLEMVGYTREDLRAGRISGATLNTPERDQTDATARAELAERGVARPWEKELFRKDGTRVPILIGVVMLDAEERETVAFTLDLSERKRVEAARAEALDVARREALGRERAERALLDTEEQLRQSQKMEAIGTLAGGVAHDFNNILSIILGFSELLLSELGPADSMRNDLEQIALAGRRASTLTRQLLAFSRRQVLQPKVVNLNEAVTAMASMLQRVIGEDIELVFLTSKELGATLVDPGQMEQVLLNLVVNARDAMPQGGKLTIETGNVELDATYCDDHFGVEPGRYVVLSVSDTGAGMDRATQARIFEPFFTTKELGKGTGLGLSTVHGIIKQSGGHIWVYSEVGAGSTFKIYLPRTEDGAVDTDRGHATADALRGSETILLAEDDVQVRTLAATILRRHGYRVLEAESGGEALLLSAQHHEPAHLLLTDVVMPKMSGRELWQRLAPLRPEMKVLFMSGYTDDAIVRHGVLGSEFEFVQKPISATALLTKVRSVLDSTPHTT